MESGPQAEPVERSLSTKERIGLGVVAAILSIVGVVALWIPGDFPFALFVVIGWPIHGMVVVVFFTVGISIQSLVGEDLAILIIRVVLFLLLWAFSFLRLLLLYVAIRWVVRLFKRWRSKNRPSQGSFLPEPSSGDK